MPLGGTGIFHPRWSQHHRPSATTTLTSTCRITRASGDGATDPDTGDWDPAGTTVVYTGRCRIVSPPFSHEQVDNGGEAQVTSRRYGVTVEWDAPEPRVGDVVELLEAADPLLAGREFRIVDVVFSSEQWQRNLACEEIEGRT